jgi:hypothetical protein
MTGMPMRNEDALIEAFNKFPWFWLDFFFYDEVNGGCERNRMYNKSFPPLWKNITTIIRNTIKIITVIAITRGLGKTHVVTIGMVLGYIVVDKRDLVIIDTAIEKKGKEIVDSIEYLLQLPKFLKWYGSGDFRNIKGTPWNRSEGIFTIKRKGGETATIGVLGWKQAAYGKVIKGSRIDILILDDTTKDEDVSSPNAHKITKGKIARFTKEHEEAVTTNDRYGRAGKIFIVDTPKSDYDFITAAMGWKDTLKIVVPAIANNEVIAKLAGVQIGESVWEEMKSLKFLMAKKEQLEERGELHTWLTQYMMEPHTPKEVRFDESKRVDITQEKAWKIIRQKGGNIVCCVDMANTKESYSDHVGFNTTAHVPGRPGMMYSLKTYRKKMTGDDVHDYLIKVIGEYGIFPAAHELDGKGPTFGGIWIESKAYDLIVAYFQTLDVLKSAKIGKLINVASYCNSLKRKPHLANDANRINGLVGYYNSGIMQFVEGENEDFILEGKNWTGQKLKNAEDSALDAAAYQPGFMEVPIDETESKADDFATYLDSKNRLTAEQDVKIKTQEWKQEQVVTSDEDNEYVDDLFLEVDMFRDNIGEQQVGLWTF